MEIKESQWTWGKINRIIQSKQQRDKKNSNEQYQGYVEQYQKAWYMCD